MNLFLLILAAAFIYWMIGRTILLVADRFLIDLSTGDSLKEIWADKQSYSLKNILVSTENPGDLTEIVFSAIWPFFLFIIFFMFLIFYIEKIVGKIVAKIQEQFKKHRPAKLIESVRNFFNKKRIEF